MNTIKTHGTILQILYCGKLPRLWGFSFNDDILIVIFLNENCFGFRKSKN